MKRILFINTIDRLRKSFTKYTKIRLFDVKKMGCAWRKRYGGFKLSQNIETVSFYYPFCTANNMNSEQSICIAFWFRFLILLCLWFCHLLLEHADFCQIRIILLNTTDQYRCQVSQCTHFM